MAVTVRKITGQRKDGFHYVTDDNFIFHHYKTEARASTGTTLYFRCSLFKKEGCRARMKKREDDGIYWRTGENHCHQDEKGEIERLEVVRECVQRAVDVRARPKQVFEEVRERHENVVIGFNPALERRMQYAKASAHPSNPRTIDEAENLLHLFPDYKQTKDGRDFYHGRVSFENGTALIFLSLSLLPQLKETNRLNADGTFKIVPHLFYQLFTIHISAYGQLFPLAYVLMTEKTLGLYNAVLQSILAKFRETCPLATITVELCISDYENSIMQCMATSFPLAKVRGCWFHYGQAIYRRACKLGLQISYMSGGIVQDIVKQLIALPLLPSDRAYEGFQTIKSQFAAALLNETPEIQTAVAKLYVYMGGYWFGTVGSESFSVYGDTVRTNNEIEAFNRWLNAKCVGVHLNFWDFVDVLKDDAFNKKRDFLAKQSVEQTTRAKPKRRQRREIRIADITRDFDTKLISIKQFLELAANLFDPVRIPRTSNIENTPAANAPAVQRLRIFPRPRNQRQRAGIVRPDLAPAVPQEPELPNLHIVQLHPVEMEFIGVEMHELDPPAIESQNVERAIEPEHLSVVLLPVEPEPVVLLPVEPEPVVFHPIEPEPVVFHPIDPEPVVFHPIEPEPVVFHPIDPEPVVLLPVEQEPVIFHPIDPKPFVGNPIEPVVISKRRSIRKRCLPKDLQPDGDTPANIPKIRKRKQKNANY